MIDDPAGLNINRNINKKCIAAEAVGCSPLVLSAQGRGTIDKVGTNIKLHLRSVLVFAGFKTLRHIKTIFCVSAFLWARIESQADFIFFVCQMSIITYMIYFYLPQDVTVNRYYIHCIKCRTLYNRIYFLERICISTILLDIFVL